MISFLSASLSLAWMAKPSPRSRSSLASPSSSQHAPTTGKSVATGKFCSSSDKLYSHPGAWGADSHKWNPSRHLNQEMKDKQVPIGLYSNVYVLALSSEVLPLNLTPLSQPHFRWWSLRLHWMAFRVSISSVITTLICIWYLILPNLFIFHKID